jgi:hypothetical protein
MFGACNRFAGKVNHKTGEISNLLAAGGRKKVVGRQLSYPFMSSYEKIL